MQRLNREFFQLPTLQVAKELIGKTIIYYNHQALITETEAYIGQDDPASHAARGLTNRTKPMFGQAGHLYVYLIYGIYYCLNIVTEELNFPAAVLIRGIRLLNEPYLNLNGPGKLCRFLQIDKRYNNLDIVNDQNFYLINSINNFTIEATPRIGIKVGVDKLWRFVAK